ncbi:MAG: hypothetical protein HZA93_20070 [Verrucomicrobia bacterium]|nr:hypothetical protein [Verrucomicrobiota bacterium]
MKWLTTLTRLSGLLSASGALVRAQVAPIPPATRPATAGWRWRSANIIGADSSGRGTPNGRLDLVDPREFRFTTTYTV